MAVRQCKAGGDGAESSGPGIIYGSIMIPVCRDSPTERKPWAGKGGMSFRRHNVHQPRDTNGLLQHLHCSATALQVSVMAEQGKCEDIDAAIFNWVTQRRCQTLRLYNQWQVNEYGALVRWYWQAEGRSATSSTTNPISPGQGQNPGTRKFAIGK